MNQRTHRRDLFEGNGRFWTCPKCNKPHDRTKELVPEQVPVLPSVGEGVVTIMVSDPDFQHKPGKCLECGWEDRSMTRRGGTPHSGSSGSHEQKLKNHLIKREERRARRSGDRLIEAIVFAAKRGGAVENIKRISPAELEMVFQVEDDAERMMILDKLVENRVVGALTDHQWNETKGEREYRTTYYCVP